MELFFYYLREAGWRVMVHALVLVFVLGCVGAEAQVAQAGQPVTDRPLSDRDEAGMKAGGGPAKVGKAVEAKAAEGKAAVSTTPVPWIRPDNARGAALWGIHNGIVVGLWPTAIEGDQSVSEGGPRGLLRIGYEYGGIIYHINYIAVEPVVDGDMEFSEVSPSQADGQWGKFFWASDTVRAGGFSPYALTRGVIRHPDLLHPETEELSFYVFMEKFIDGAHPYLRVSIRSDRPEELGLEIFNQDKSAVMERCALTATMGNYSRLRLLYLKDRVIDSRVLFREYKDIEFAEKEPYPAGELLRDKRGGFWAIAETNESFSELASWPQVPAYQQRWHWRYRPFYKLTQYWRADAASADSSLQVRVNGRAKYWSGGSDDKSLYVDIPGGPAFENFELRQRYKPGQKFYFGLTRKPAAELIRGLKE